ncbi:Glycerophosphoryl diester phosphodiesterase, partial [Globisporangium splendens]
MAKVWYTSTLLLAVAGMTTAQTTNCQVARNVTSPTIIGHRGAPGYLPEHTLEGYTLAIEMGVDFIEPDLVMTKDGVLVSRHEPNIIDTTDVSDHPEFADRKKTVKIDGIPFVGFFVSDFTLAEIKTLRAKQAMVDRDHSYDGLYEIPTFDEIIALAKAKAIEVNRTIGIYPETKHSFYHRNLSLPLEEKILSTLEAAGWNNADAPVYIQSFEQSNLQEIRKNSTVKLVQLVDAYGAPYDWTVSGRNGTFLDMLTKEGLDEVKTYANVIAPYKRQLVSVRGVQLSATGSIVDSDGDGVVGDSDYYTYVNNTIIEDAHARGLLVHTWTFRDESYRLARNYSNDPKLEYIDFFSRGIDGLFSDNGKTAVAAREIYLNESTQTNCSPETSTTSGANQAHMPTFVGFVPMFLGIGIELYRQVGGN